MAADKQPGGLHDPAAQQILGVILNLDPNIENIAQLNPPKPLFVTTSLHFAE